MKTFSEIIYLNPNQIQINRSSRQRKTIDISDILDSIRENGIINPIIIKREELKNPLIEGITYFIDLLIAGERRLEACKQLNIQVPCRLFNSLSPLEAQIIEFEENHKRKNLNWRDEVRAIGNIYNLSISQSKSKFQIANSLSLSESKLDQILYVSKNLDEKILSFAENLTQAISLLHKFKSQKSEELKQNLKQILDTKPIPDYLKPKPLILNLTLDKDNESLPKSKIQPQTSKLILNLNFLSWIEEYSGPKFNLIHLDFPQSQENFWPCFDSFLKNRNKILDNQTHILLWFKFENYRLIKNSLDTYFGPESIIPQPLIWYKSDIKSNQITNDPPKSTYEPCLIINHGNRPFLKQIQNAYHTPHVSQPVCPNQKSIPMLKYFFQTFIDSTTNFLDPTCGSGSSLIASEELKPKSFLGLEINPFRFEKANERILRNRELKQLLEK